MKYDIQYISESFPPQQCLCLSPVSWLRQKNQPARASIIGFSCGASLNIPRVGAGKYGVALNFCSGGVVTVSSVCGCSCHHQPGRWCEKHAVTLIGVVLRSEFATPLKKLVERELDVCERSCFFINSDISGMTLVVSLTPVYNLWLQLDFSVVAKPNNYLTVSVATNTFHETRYDCLILNPSCII